MLDAQSEVPPFELPLNIFTHWSETNMSKSKKTMCILLCLLFVLNIFTLLSSVSVSASSNNWSWPTSIHSIQSDWPTYSSGKYHGGTDFPVSLNSPVYSTCDGEVVAVTSLTTSYGKHIKIRAVVNGETVFMRYCHLNSFAVSERDKVTSGQLIGYSGSTGNSTGPHLHYEVRNANDYYGNASSPNLNPRNYLPGSGYSFETYGEGFPGAEDTSWNVPVWKTANYKLNTYDSYGNQETSRWIDQGDNCYIEKVYQNGYAWVKYPSSASSDGFRWAYTMADGFSLEKKNVVNNSIVDLGDSFSARIRHGNSGKLLTDISDNVALYDHQNDNIANQIWKFQKNSNGSYKIISSVSDVAMDLDCASDSDGTNIKLYTNYSTIAQNWFIHQSADGLYYFRSECSQTRVFDLCGGATDNNTNLQLWTYNGTDAQKFRIDKCAEILNLGDEFKGFIMNTDCWKPIMQTDDNNVVLGTENTKNMRRSLWHFYRNKETGYYTIYNYLNGKCLDVHNALDEDGANVQCFDQNDTAAQKWFILRSSDGAYTYMKSACSSNNLDVENGSTEHGANIQMYTLNGTSAQKFTIYKLDETRDKISYNLIINKSDIYIGDSMSIEITNAIYAIDYKLYIVNPDGSKDTIALDMNNNYIFSPTKAGKYTIFAGVMSPVSSYTGSETENSLEINVNAKIIPGDVNYDDIVNMKDIVLLQQYLNNWGVEINTDASDVNNDGVINMKDIVLLQQYMNGWDVVLQ